MQKNLHVVAFDYSKAIECQKIIDKSDKPVIICLPSDQDALILLKELKVLVKDLDIDFLSSNGNQPYQFKPNNYENQLSRVRSLGKIYKKSFQRFCCYRSITYFIDSLPKRNSLMRHLAFKLEMNVMMKLSTTSLNTNS